MAEDMNKTPVDCRLESPNIHNKTLTPSTRQRRHRIAKQIVDFVESFQLEQNDKAEVFEIARKRMNLQTALKFVKKPSKSGRKLTPMETRQKIWDFYHRKSLPSTITSRPAKLRCTDIPKIQLGLGFVDTMTIIIQRNKKYYQSIHHVLNQSIKVLYQDFVKAYPNHPVSYGTFLALKPFYIRNATEKDIEMCCCKKHLHACWSVQALISCSEKQKISLQEIDNYDSFFAYLYQDCPKDDLTYINWECVENKNTLCDHIQKRWNELKEAILAKDDKVTYVNMQHFDKVQETTKGGKVVQRLKAVATKANLEYITNFITEILPKITHHRNHLKHYRSCINQVKQTYNATYIDIDFAENLNVPVKFEPQSMHWSHEQITVHSAIIKHKGEKQYHPYLSNDRKHDQHFVHTVLDTMLDSFDFEESEYLIIESDNCAAQYKSSVHFESIQRLSDKYDIKIIRLFGIPEHGKGEVDHVGGIAKTAI